MHNNKKWLKLIIILIVSIVFTNCNKPYNNDEEYYTPKVNNKKDQSDGVLNRLNYYRKGIGLKPVNLNIDMNLGASLHTKYMHKNNVVTHFQDPKKPAYNILGAETGMGSVLAGNIENGTEAVDLWMNSLYHRQYLLDPDLENIGFSFLEGFATMNLGLSNDNIKEKQETSDEIKKNDTNKSNYNTFVNFNTIKKEPIIFPFENQKDVPVAFNIIESPNPVPEYLSIPTGPFITITLDETVTIDNINKAVVTDEFGNKIDVAKFLAHNKEYVLAILPEKPLKYNTKYTVNIDIDIEWMGDFSIDNSDNYTYNYKKIWSFITTSKNK